MRFVSPVFWGAMLCLSGIGIGFVIDAMIRLIDGRLNSGSGVLNTTAVVLVTVSLIVTLVATLYHFKDRNGTQHNLVIRLGRTTGNLAVVKPLMVTLWVLAFVGALIGSIVLYKVWSYTLDIGSGFFSWYSGIGLLGYFMLSGSGLGSLLLDLVRCNQEQASV